MIVRPFARRAPQKAEPGALMMDHGRTLRCGVAIVIGLLVANCAGPRTVSGGRHPSEARYGVASSPRVIPEGQPIPKGGGRDLTGKPYVVAGRTYVPHAGRGYDREGWASWYGTAFHGRLTANGEIFDRASIAAAHPTLPLPSYVRVTNVVNRRSMIVRVNDRGPYERSRVIDLSERAAEALGFRQRGTGRVRVQFVGRASVDGSDDEKLLATLTTDGAPASLDGARRPTMLARQDLDEDRPLRDPPRGVREPAGTRLSRAALPEYDERVPVPQPRPASKPVLSSETVSSPKPVSTGTARERGLPPPLDIRPPSRPDLAAIY